jgi:methionyl-tRNA formyltransferase
MTGAAAVLRVVFLGTPEFALPSLRALAVATTIAAVVTRPDQPAGRGRRMTPPPAAAAARALGLPVLQPESLRAAATLEALRALSPDLLVTVAYGRIIPPAVLALPPRGCINLHPSLLPAYRGAAPIQRAIADGASTTGVTIMYQSEELDAGDIILQHQVAIQPEETAGELATRLAELGAGLLVEAVDLIGRGAAPRQPQDHARATYAGRMTKADGALHWGRPARDLANQIRAVTPWPGAYTQWRGGLLKVWRARAGPGSVGAEPGTVLGADRSGVTVACGEGVLLLLDVQPEGGRRMPAEEFLRGHRLEPGERLSEAAPANARHGMVE